MSDDPNKRRPQDANLISLTEDWEVEYWTKELGISKERLKNAVKAVGNSVDAVKKYLGK